jgi:hypothetical protein
MIVLIQGPPDSGTSAFADRIVSALQLAPVAWPITEDIIQRVRSTMGQWVDPIEYFAQRRHIDMDRVLTLLQIEKRDVLPRAPRWQPGSDRSEMLKWRRDILREIHGGRFLPDLFALTCRLIDSQEHSVVEGGLLGSSLNESLLTRRLRSHYEHVPMLKVLLQGHPGAAGQGSAVALVNGSRLTADELLRDLRREPDGRISVSPVLGWTWAGSGEESETRGMGER